MIVLYITAGPPDRTKGGITGTVVLGGRLSESKANRSSYINLGLGWQKLTDTPERLSDASICAMEDGFLLLGGHLRGEVTNSTHHYSIERQMWSQLSDVPTARTCAASVRFGPWVYVLGGMVLQDDGEWVPVDSCECLNTSEDTWTKLAPIKQGMMRPITAVIDEYIYVLFNDDRINKPTQQGSIRTLQRYNHISRSCSFMQPLPDSVGWTSGARAASVSGSMYVVGGDARLCEMYSPHSDSWTRLTPPGYDHLDAAVVEHNSKLMVLGGGCYIDEEMEGSNIVEEYDTDLDTWARSSYTMPVGLYNHCVIVCTRL